MATEIDGLWDFDDPKGSEARFRQALDEPELDDATRAELLTQLGRALGLQRRFDDAHDTLDAACALAAAGSRQEVRYMLERGRVLNTSGARHSSVTCFLQAFEAARACQEDGLAVDAAHMLGIVEEPAEALQWNLRALAVAESSPQPAARKWRASLLNNIGWAAFEQGDFATALERFRAAHACRVEMGQTRQEQIARWCIARTLRALGQAEEALAMQEALAQESEGDGYIHEELAELYAARGEWPRARQAAQKAVHLLGADDWFANGEPVRWARIQALADGAESEASPHGVS